MQKYRFYLFVLIFATSFLVVSCNGGDAPSSGGPTIVNFDASSGSGAVAPGASVTLSWRINGEVDTLTLNSSVGTSPGVVTGTTSAVVQPNETTTYTLIAESSSGSSRATLNVDVSGNPTDPNPPPGSDTTAPSGTFGLSDAQGGPFQNDKPENITSPDDSRIVTVAPGGTFYAQVEYSDPSGITNINISLVNGAPPNIKGELGPTDPELGYFTRGEPTGNCTLSPSAVDVTCVYPITVSEEAVNISELDNAGNEFAYVFRTLVTDNAGNQSEELTRGYVIVDGDGGTPPTDPNPPNPPDESAAPSIDSFTAESDTVAAGEDFELAWTLSGGDVDTLTLVDTNRNQSAEVTDTTSRTVSIQETTTFELTATNEDGSDKETVEITVETDQDPPENQSPSADFTFEQQPDSLSVKFSGLPSNDEDGTIDSYSWDFGDGGDKPESRDWTRNYGEAKAYEVTLSVTDDDGATDEETKTVTVNPVGPTGDAPIINSFTADPNPAAENEEVTIAWNLAGGDPTTLTLTDLETNGSREVTGEQNTKITAVSSRDFRLTATNQAGTVTETLSLDVSGTVVVPPDGNGGLDAVDDQEVVSVSEDGSIEIDIIANDDYPDGVDNFPNVVVISEPAHGEAFLDGELILYTPEEDYVGEDTFEYRLTIRNRAEGTSFTDTATVTIDVQP